MLVQPQSLTPALHELSLDNLVLILYCIKFFENWSVVWSSFYFSGPFLNCNHQIGFILTWRIYTHILYESFKRFWSSQLQCNVYYIWFCESFYTARSAGQRSCVNRQHLGRRGRLELGAVVGQGSCAMIGQCPIVLGSPRLRCTLYRNCTVGSSVHCTLVYSADCSEGSADHSFVKCLFY